MDDYYDEMNEYFDSLPIHYSVTYFGAIYDGDSDSYNKYETESFDDAMRIYRDVVQYDKNAYLDDNIYGVTFRDGEWF